MTPFKLFFTRIFSIDPSLEEAKKKTDRLVATMNGDSGWMLVCNQKLDYSLECDDGNTYRKENKK